MKLFTYTALAIGLGVLGCQGGGQGGAEQRGTGETGTTGTQTGTTGTQTEDTGAYGTGGGTQGTQQGQPPGEGGTMGGEGGAMGTGGGTATGGQAQGACQRLSSCYDKLSQDLCQGTQAEQCKQQFKTDNLPQDEAQCQSRLSQVSQQAQPYMQAQPDFQMPQECSAGGM